MWEVVVEAAAEAGIAFLLEKSAELLEAAWLGQLNRENFKSKDVGGGKFISRIGHGKVVSMYWHPTKKHSATAKGGLFCGEAKSVAPAGKWAVAICNVGGMGAKTFWDDDAK